MKTAHTSTDTTEKYLETFKVDYDTFKVSYEQIEEKGLVKDHPVVSDCLDRLRFSQIGESFQVSVSRIPVSTVTFAQMIRHQLELAKIHVVAKFQMIKDHDHKIVAVKVKCIA